jgi:hypothetical protein
LAECGTTVILKTVPETPWEPDGTQPPPPTTVWDDPVSGLVTGATYEAEPIRIDLADPVEPDMSEVRRAVDAVLAGEDALSPTIPAPRAPATPAQPPACVPPNPRAGWPRTPSARQPARIQRVRDPRTSTGASVAAVVAVLIVLGVLVTIVIGIIAGVVNTITQLFS